MTSELRISTDKNININNNLKENQEKFLSSALGKVINNAIDIGLRSVLPNIIEDEIINIKDTILENGFKEGINSAISSSINFGKSAIGIFTGQFDNTKQIEMAIKKGGIIDTVSDLLDLAVKTANKKGLIDNTISSLIKSGKNTILDTLSEKIESSLENQIKSIEKLESYCEKWNEYYKLEDFDKMEKTFKNIEKYINKTIPLENTIKTARKIENLHNLIKNNGQDFKLSEEEKKLAEKLIN